MTEMTLQHSLRSSHAFAEILSASNEWQTIDDLVAICDEAGYWDVGFEYRALANAKKTRIRKIINNLKDKEGFPLFPSITIIDDDGNRKRVYKQEMLFNVEDYKTIVNYHERLSCHHREMAEGYVKRCEQNHEVQLMLWKLDNIAIEPLDDEWTETSSNAPGNPR